MQGSRALACGPLRELVLKAAQDNEIFAALAGADAALANTPKPEVKS